MMTREEQRERKKSFMYKFTWTQKPVLYFQLLLSSPQELREKAFMRTQDAELHSQYLSSFTNDRVVLQLYDEWSSLCIRAGETVG